MNITLVPPEGVKKLWNDTLAPMVEEAAKYSGGRFTAVDVYIDCLSGSQSMWIAYEDGEIKGCCTVKIVNYPNLKSCLLDVIAGNNVDEWLEDGFKVISRYARHHGCTKMEGNGRPGWEPRIRKLGWKRSSVLFEYDLPEQGDE